MDQILLLVPGGAGRRAAPGIRRLQVRAGHLVNLSPVATFQATGGAPHLALTFVDQT